MDPGFVIAVADSDAGVAAALSSALLAHGFEVLPVRSNDDLVGPPPDAVLLDCAVDAEIVQRIEREWCGARIVYTTADRAERIDILQKPFSISEALDAIFRASH